MKGRLGWILGVVVVLVTVVLFLANTPTSHAQLDPTSTPDAEGIIYDTVRDGDTMYAIAYRNGITLEELLTFNNLSETDFIHPGDLLIVGIVDVNVTATPDVLATPTPTRPPPTPTNTAVPPPPTQICLLAYMDDNANGVFDIGEGLQTAVAITVFTAETVIVNYITDGVSEPYCTADLEPGEYQVTRSILQGETLTTSGNRTVLLQSGDVVTLQFGGTKGAVVVTPNVAGLETAVSATPEPITNTAVGTGSGVVNTPPPSSPPDSTENPSSLIAVTVVIIGSLFLGGALVLILRLRQP